MTLSPALAQPASTPDITQQPVSTAQNAALARGSPKAKAAMAKRAREEEKEEKEEEKEGPGGRKEQRAAPPSKKTKVEGRGSTSEVADGDGGVMAKGSERKVHKTKKKVSFEAQ
jgi:hypothetical protein